VTAIATATSVRFHVGLSVADLPRSVEFYRHLLGVEPSKHLDDYAKFELDQPALVLALHPSPQSPGGPLNHLGLRLPTAEMLVSVQRRLEEAGIATQRQEGVECCYARQTKFWVTDPDRTLWEIYTLHEDIDHSGFDDPPSPDVPAPQAIWEHRLSTTVPPRIPHPDASLDEVRLEGTFNAVISETALTSLLTDVLRVLKPNGRVSAHGLVADRPFPGVPRLPGLASLVERVPVETEALEALRQAGFRDIFYERLADIHCFNVGGIELREMRLSGFKPAAATTGTCSIMYKGPFEQVEDDDGTVFPRGQHIVVRQNQAERLKRGPAAEQFAYLPN
jgi:catechol 2,3-dioxygenase-like lactoylglutathione lyase family enzyme